MLVINNNLRHLVITAKMINTIDHASGGRAELGNGAGNLEVDPTVARDALLARRPSGRYDDPETQTRDSILLGSVAEVKEQEDRWTDAGINHFILMTPRPFDRGMMERFAVEVAPAFA